MLARSSATSRDLDLKIQQDVYLNRAAYGGLIGVSFHSVQQQLDHRLLSPTKHLDSLQKYNMWSITGKLRAPKRLGDAVWGVILHVFALQSQGFSV